MLMQWSGALYVEGRVRIHLADGRRARMRCRRRESGLPFTAVALRGRLAPGSSAHPRAPFPPREPNMPIHTTSRLAVIVLVVHLAAAGFAAAQVQTRLVLPGAAPNDEFGAAVATAGDVDGDGCADVIVGAPFDATAGVDAGRAVVYSGRDGSVLWTFYGMAGQWLGHSVAGGVDCDADGVSDLVVGMANESTIAPGNGAVRVYSGATGLELFTVRGAGQRHRLGYSCGVAGDVDGDGHAEIIGGAPGAATLSGFAGYAYLISGANGAVLRAWAGTAGLDRFGYLVAGVDDVNADGAPDVAISAIGFDSSAGLSSGRVEVYSGAAPGALLFGVDGDGAFHELGHGLSGAGDVNGDGQADVFACANYRNGTSYARVYSGASGAVLWGVTGLGTDGFGHSASQAGDVNGDGMNDFIVGLPSDDTNGDGAGKAIVYSGADGSQLASFYGTFVQQRFGYFVGNAGDVNDDGFHDVVIGTSASGTPGYAQVSSDCAAQPYGMTGSGTQTLGLEWLRGSGGDLCQGAVRASGAAPFGGGIIAAALGEQLPPVTVSGVDVLISTDPAQLLFAFFSFDGAGAVQFALNLRQIAIDGMAFHLQVFEYNASAPAGFYSSAGLATLFCR
jgi:hypothetical protein